MAHIGLRFLGPPLVERDGIAVKLETRKALALLAYLSVTGEKQPRDTLAALLWPDHGQRNGRTVLRHLLYSLTKTLGSGILMVERESVGMDMQCGIEVDVLQFRCFAAGCTVHCPSPDEACADCVDSLKTASKFWQGDFFEGFSLRDSVAFDDWQFFQTEKLRAEYATLLEKLVRTLIARGQSRQAAPYALQWYGVDPLNEIVHSSLMTIHYMNGNRSAALRQYQQCARILREEVGAPPTQALTRLYEEMKGAFIPPHSEGEQAPDEPDEGSASQCGTPGLLRLEERRPVTVIAVDDRDSSRSAKTKQLQQLASDMAAQYGGIAERGTGGCLLVVFGKTQTNESDPELALRTALEIRQRAFHAHAGLRIGIYTGFALFTAGAAKGPARVLTGVAVNRAMTIAHEAPCGQVLAGEHTYRLTRSAFEFSPYLIRLKLRGTAIPVYRVVRLLPVPKKARGIEGVKPELIGRNEELARMRLVLDRLAAGEGHMVCLTGEAGVGKSRLVAELKELACRAFIGKRGSGTLDWLEGRCLEMSESAAYWPFRDMLRDYFALKSGSPQKALRSGLHAMVQRGILTAQQRENIAPYLANLLSLPLNDQGEDAIPKNSPETIRARTFAAVRDFFLALTRRMPVVLVFEDLHWADALSLELISALAEVALVSPLLLVCVFRPSRDLKCRHLKAMGARQCGERFTEIAVEPLGPEESGRLVGELVSGRNISRRARQLILEKSGGIPFYIEEMVRAHTEARRGGARSYRPIDIQSVILDRMDHLHPELKRVLQIAASMGRVFSRPLLEEVLGGCEGQGRDVQELLWDLEDQALLHQERSFQEQEYSFSHVITQETIYGSIALPARKRLHEQVALGIERLWAGSLDERYEELAYHFSRSGNAEKAVGYLLKAGRKARLHSANGVAAAHLTSGLALLAHLPQTEQRKRIELAYHQTLGVCLSFTKGHSSGKVVEVFTRAMELSREVGGVEDRFMAALGLRRHHLLRGDLSRARHWDGELQSLAESADDQGLRERAYLMRAETCLYTGEFQRVIDLCGLAQEYHDPARALAQAHAIGTCPGIMCGVLETLAQWHRGNPDQALRMSERTITSALEMGHPTSLLYAKTYYLMLLQHRREADAVADRAREVVALAREQDNHLLLTVGGMLSGWAVAMQGNAQTGRKWIESLLAAARADHVGGWFCYFSGLLSEAYLKENLLEKALSTVSYALERAEVTGERFWEAELFRLKAEILSKSKASATRSPSASGEDEGIEDLLVKAMDAARGQGSLALELRAAVAYGRHRKEQGRDGWQKIVRGVFRKCSEGFNTPDLLDAKDLLARK